MQTEFGGFGTGAASGGAGCRRGELRQKSDLMRSPNTQRMHLLHLFFISSSSLLHLFFISSSSSSVISRGLAPHALLEEVRAHAQCRVQRRHVLLQ